jgi:uncharacterized protein YukE
LAKSRLRSIDISIGLVVDALRSVTDRLGPNNPTWNSPAAQTFNVAAQQLVSDITTGRSALQDLHNALASIPDPAAGLEHRMKSASVPHPNLNHKVMALYAQVAAAGSGPQLSALGPEAAALHAELQSTGVPMTGSLQGLETVIMAATSAIDQAASTAPVRNWQNAHLRMPHATNPRAVRHGQVFIPIPGTLYDGKPRPHQVRQGKVGDCYLLGTAAALAMHHPGLISKRIVNKGNGLYQVTLFIRGKWRHYDVNSSELVIGGPTHFKDKIPRSELQQDGPNFQGQIPVMGKNGQRVLWPAVLEKAYAKAMHGYPNMDHGGYAGKALTALTGHPANWKDTTMGSSSLGHLLNKLDQSNQAVAFGSKPGPAASQGIPFIKGSPIIAGHCYFLESYNHSTGMVQLGNPWDNNNPPPMSLHEVSKYFSQVSYTTGI